MVDTVLPSAVPSAAAAATKAERTEIRNRWLLAAPSLVIIAFAAAGPLLIMLVYSFLTKGSYGGVVWQFSTDGGESWTDYVTRHIYQPLGMVNSSVDKDVPGLATGYGRRMPDGSRALARAEGLKG